MASVVHPDEVQAVRAAGAEVRRTFAADGGAARLAQSIVRVSSDGYEPEPLADRQLVMYVAAGRGTLELEGDAHPLQPDTGVFVAPGERFSLARDGEADLVLVVVETPADREPAANERKVTVRFDEQPHLEASSERTFRYLVNEDAGCFDVTQFVGIVEPSKAPFHSHPYDEVGYVIDGNGIAHLDGAEIAIRAGSCFHLAPEQVHCIENTGPGAMRILGVFHPSGSPAQRSYQDNNEAATAS
jgi:quercetin dioxygenase-like cupin family protein